MKGMDWIAIFGVVMIVAILGRDPAKTATALDSVFKGGQGLVATLEGATPGGFTAPSSL